MILSFGDQNLQECWREASCDIAPASIRRVLMRKLDLLEFADSIQDLMIIPGCQVKPLDQTPNSDVYALTLDESWELVFRYDNGFRDISLKQA